MAKTGKDKFKIRQEMLPELISRLEDLTKISDSLRIKIEGDSMMAYSTLGKSTVLAFKNYLMKTSEILEGTEDLQYGIDIIILNAKKFVKNLAFLKESEKVTMDISHKESQDSDEVMIARAIQVAGGKLKVNWIGGEHYEMKDLSKKQLDQGLNLKNSRWSFKISRQDFLDIKKLSSINGEKILNISISGGKVVISETAAWEMQIDQIEAERNSTLMLNKRFLGCINESEEVVFNIFDNFMLIKHGDSNLMLSFEQDWGDEDDI